MPIEYITRQEFIDFQQRLFEKIDLLILHNAELPKEKTWKRAGEVQQLLNMSDRTLRKLRLRGSLPYTRIGGIVYYDYDSIRLLLQNKA